MQFYNMYITLHELPDVCILIITLMLAQSCLLGTEHHIICGLGCLLQVICPISNVCLLSAVAEVKLKDSQYTLDHVRAFGMYNYLHIDPWYEDSVYFVDSKGRVLNLTVTLVSLLMSFLKLWVIRAHHFFYLPQNACVDHTCTCILLTKFYKNIREKQGA